LAEPRLVVATGNAGKMGEYVDLLSSSGFQLIPFESEVEEVGETYRENARLKAEAARDSTGLPSLGDDAGVEVDVLGGFPGIRSARIGPTQKERTQALLDKLAGHPGPWFARFVCTIALAAPGLTTEYFEGHCTGEIVPEWRGNAGFGYDPVFLVPEADRTFGEMTPEEKAKYSHRAAAVRELLASGFLARLLT
jgi:XTP/dITP diphosphohydrolase